MSSVQSLRDFISERLAAAAAEIFSEFEKTIVQYEEEIDRQRRLLDVTWRPEMHTNTTEAPQQHVHKEERMKADQQLRHEESDSCQDRDEPEPPPLEEEQDELFTGPEEGPLVLNQATQTAVLLQHTSKCEEKLEAFPEDVNQLKTEMNHQHRRPDINWNPQIKLHRIEQRVFKKEDVLADQQLCHQERRSSLDQEEPGPLKLETTPTYQCCFSEPQPDDEQLRCLNSPLTESPNQVQTKTLDSGSTPDVSMNSSGRCVYVTCGNNGGQPAASQSPFVAQPDTKPFQCDVCRKTFRGKHGLRRHSAVHTCEKTLDCKTCGECFSRMTQYLAHLKTHPVVKPYSCQTCGKGYTTNNYLTHHMVTSHPKEKPFSCGRCGENFRLRETLSVHMRTHSRGRLHSCGFCRKVFTQKGSLEEHMVIHSRRKPYACEVCRKTFCQRNSLRSHMTAHKGNIFTCETCGKKFPHRRNLGAHVKFHYREETRGNTGRPTEDIC